MVVGKAAVDLGEQGEVLARQPLHQPLDYGSGGAVAAVPAYPEGLAVEALQQPLDVALDHVLVADGAGAFLPIAGRGDPPQLLDSLAEEGAVLQHHLEAVVIARIVASGD